MDKQSVAPTDSKYICLDENTDPACSTPNRPTKIDESDWELVTFVAGIAAEFKEGRMSPPRDRSEREERQRLLDTADPSTQDELSAPRDRCLLYQLTLCFPPSLIDFLSPSTPFPTLSDES